MKISERILNAFQAELMDAKRVSLENGFDLKEVYHAFDLVPNLRDESYSDTGDVFDLFRETVTELFPNGIKNPEVKRVVTKFETLVVEDISATERAEIEALNKAAAKVRFAAESLGMIRE